MIITQRLCPEFFSWFNKMRLWAWNNRGLIRHNIFCVQPSITGPVARNVKMRPIKYIKIASYLQMMQWWELEMTLSWRSGLASRAWSIVVPPCLVFYWVLCERGDPHTDQRLELWQCCCSWISLNPAYTKRLLFCSAFGAMQPRTQCTNTLVMSEATDNWLLWLANEKLHTSLRKVDRAISPLHTCVRLAAPALINQKDNIVYFWHSWKQTPLVKSAQVRTHPVLSAEEGDNWKLGGAKRCRMHGYTLRLVFSSVFCYTLWTDWKLSNSTLSLPCNGGTWRWEHRVIRRGDNFEFLVL